MYTLLCMHHKHTLYGKVHSNMKVSCNCTYFSQFNENIWEIYATKLQIIVINLKFEFNAIYAPNLLSIWQILFEFEHFNATFPLSVISMKKYQISLQLNFKLSVINFKLEFNAMYAPYLLSIWQIHFEFEHFIATVPISVILKKNYQISRQLNFKWTPIYLKFESVQYMHQIIERLTNALRVWTFHCNCPYISHLKKELPDITATKHQMNSDQSEIWFSAIYTPNLLNVWQIHFEFEHLIATVPISVILKKNYKISLQLKFKWTPINLKFDAVQYMHQIY